MNTQPLTTFRFIAAATVVFFHYGKETGLGLTIPGFIDSAREMVTFFFVLSGFIMVVVYYQAPKYSLGAFYIHRVARIAPVYFLALAPMVYLIYVVRGDTDYTALMLCLFFIQAWVPEYALSINYPAWSLSVEAFFYLTFPLIILYLRKSPPSANGFLLVSILVWCTTQAALFLMITSDHYVGEGHNDFYRIILCSPLTNYSSFLLGNAGAYFVISKGMKVRPSTNPSLMLMVGCGLILFLILEYKAIDWLAGFEAPPQTTAPLFLFFIIILTFSDNVVTRMISNKYMLLLGEASYALYILQVPVKKFSYWALQPLSLNPEIRFYVFFLILTGVSVVSYLYFEKPIRAYTHTLTRKLKSQG